MPRPYSLGVLFVHGIGQQRRGETLIRFGEPLARAVQDRFTRAAPRAALQPGQPGMMEFSQASLDDSNTPPNVAITLRNIHSFRSTPQAQSDSKWLFAEAWWAELFPTPTFGEITRWSCDILPWTLIGHFDTRLRRAWFRLRGAPTWEEQASASADWLRQVLHLSLVILAAPLLVACLFVILLIAALPVPYARDVAAWLQRKLAATIGDSYVLVGWPIARAAILSRVARDFAWLSKRCERVVIVAHSQGAAIAHEFLRSDALAPCDALITFGSGLRKLSEVRDAIESTGRGWLRLLALTGPAVAGLALALFAVSGGWRWLVAAAIAVALAVSRVALVRWRRLNNQSVSMNEQWVTDRKQYHRWFRLPHPHRVPWLDGFASADPVPNGPLFDDLLPDEMRTRAFHNGHSMLGDHTSYWRNRDDFVARLSVELLRQADIDPVRIDADDVARQEVASARRRCRVSWLRASRWAAVLAGVVAIAAWWRDAPGAFAGPVSAVAGALSRVPWLGTVLAEHEGAGLGHIPGIATIFVAVAVWSVLLRLPWLWWNARDVQRRFRREDYPLADMPSAIFVTLLVAGCAAILWATWLTGDRRVPTAVILGMAAIFVLAAVTEATGATEVLKTWFATLALGPVNTAYKRLRECDRRRLERGARRKLGWATCELGRFVRSTNEPAAVAHWERALDLGFGKAAWHLGLYFGERNPNRAIKYFSIGMDKGDPECAWFKGRAQEARGDLSGAIATYRDGLEKLKSPQCAHNLGSLLAVADPAGARAAFEDGINLGDALSAEFLGSMLRREAEGLPPGADRRRALLIESEALFQKALQLGAAEAAIPLGEVLLELEDVAGARKAFGAGMQLRQPLAAFKLGGLAVLERDYVMARRALERCIDLADDRVAAEANFELGRVFERMGRAAAAQRCYRRAIGTSGGVGSVPAALRLAEIVEASGSDERAVRQSVRDIYRRAIELGAADAAIRLGRFEEQHHALSEAESAYRQGMELGSAESALELGRFLSELRFDPQQANEAYLRAWRIDEGEVPAAWVELIERHHDAGGARAALAESGRFIGDRHLQRLGKVLETRGDREGAAAAYARMKQPDQTLQFPN